MKSTLIVVGSALTLFAACATRSFNSNQASPRYVASNSIEANLSFDAAVQFVSTTEPETEDAKDKIQAQVTYLFGPMSMVNRKAVPKENHRITRVKIALVDANKHVYEASYHYSGTMAIEKGPDTYEVFLPVNPDTIYKTSMVGEKNPCTDDHYQTEGDFWYFWSPDRRGCKLKKDVDYKVFPAKVTAKDNSLAKSYPEYPRLADDNGVVTISLLMGLDDGSHSWDPMSSNDYNASNFRMIYRDIQDEGFKATHKWSQDDFKALLAKHNSQPPALSAIKGGSGNRMPYVEEFEKTYSENGRYKKIHLRIFFGATGIDEKSRGFHYVFKDSIENDSMMVYAGHSGLGGHLDLASINQINHFKIKPNKDKYQIYYFNSCTSYTYYNTMYFKPKRTPQDKAGTKNLDIFTNGLATYMDVMPTTILSLVSAVDTWGGGGAAKTYQQLAQEIDTNNLFGINGDEDNPQL